MNFNQLTVTDIQFITTVHHPQGNKMNITNRDCYALSFCQSGKIVYSQDGRTLVSQKNRVMFHPKGATYSLQCTECGDFPLIEFKLAGSTPTTLGVFEISSDIPFIKIFNQMKKNFLFPTKKAKNLSLLYEIFDMLSSTGAYSENKMLAPALEILYSQYTNPDITVNSLANASHVSECYFRRLFFKTFGVSPKKYLCAQRINHAKQLLKEGTFSVTEVAFNSGFSSVYYFSKAFKLCTGITANEFIKLNAVQRM